jgi:hypothetical protein
LTGYCGETLSGHGDLGLVRNALNWLDNRGSAHHGKSGAAAIFSFSGSRCCRGWMLGVRKWRWKTRNKHAKALDKWSTLWNTRSGSHLLPCNNNAITTCIMQSEYALAIGQGIIWTGGDQQGSIPLFRHKSTEMKQGDCIRSSVLTVISYTSTVSFTNPRRWPVRK